MQFSRRSKPSNLFVVALVLAVVAAVAGTAVGLTLHSLNVQKKGLFESRTVDSDFDITTFSTKVKGIDKVDVDIELTNRDTALAHATDVLVVIVDADGGEIAMETLSTGLVLGGDVFSDKITFEEEGIALSWDHTLVILDQTS